MVDDAQAENTPISKSTLNEMARRKKSGMILVHGRRKHVRSSFIAFIWDDAQANNNKSKRFVSSTIFYDHLLWRCGSFLKYKSRSSR